MILAASIAALIAAAAYALCWYTTGNRLSPDGQIYLAAGRGERVPRPFHLRWLLPLLCRDRIMRWRVASALGLVLATCGVAWLALGLGTVRALTAAALFSALPLWRTTAALPVLVDGPALAAAAWSAALAVNGYVIAAVAVAVMGAAVKEHVPVFAAAAAWSPWLLLALVVPVATTLLRKPAEATHPSQSAPLQYARTKQAPRLFDPYRVLLPWGVCLAALWAVTPAVAVSLALAYGMLFVSADSTRIYQWAALPVCVQAAAVLPEAWIVPAVAAHVVWPWRGEV